ncbi:PREDICTED: icarapin-like [Dufourea novaeangliae]|uniref:icarapin-like n=1 Tax=Dufourea novaeangliae TaxID=178035 RepID=UPI000767721A|nr:PREDICTED: icarapin-like [Dufourea novaeangliae]
MKILVGVLFAACFVACVHSFPGSRDSDSDESDNARTLLVLPPESKDRFIRPIPFDLSDMSLEDSLEAPSWGWPNMFRSNPFGGWYSRMHEYITSLRERVSDILSRIPEDGVVSWGKIPEGANTTSTTKIIDGHVVTVNETTFRDGDDENGIVIRVRVIDVKPQNETILLTESTADGEVTTLPTVTSRIPVETGTASSEVDRTTQSRSVETVEDIDNEIPKNQVDTLTA